ncbi:MAG: MerR family DNA-binding transcriptional regulator [Candidatus Paceibacterota bacterium]|nr:MAG: MerR family DNA-binding transcriptional regulator [Candidatus Paceibacterota bacterium]
MERKFITIKQASDILGVSTLTLRNWDKSGKFKALRHPINNYRVYELSEIERLISEMKNANNQRFGKRTKKLEIKHLD